MPHPLHTDRTMASSREATLFFHAFASVSMQFRVLRPHSGSARIIVVANLNRARIVPSRYFFFHFGEMKISRRNGLRLKSARHFDPLPP
jgi:hypothetical protein